MSKQQHYKNLLKLQIALRALSGDNIDTACLYAGQLYCATGHAGLGFSRAKLKHGIDIIMDQQTKTTKVEGK